MIRNYIMFMLIGVCGILMVFSSITNSMSKRRRYSLSAMALVAIMLLLSDSLADKFDGSVDNTGFLIAKVCKFMVYFSFLLIILVFNQYLKDLFLHEGQEKEVPKRLKYVDNIIVLGEIVLIISRATNFYYTYENHVYHRSEGFIISYIFPLLALILQLTVILKHSKIFRKRLLFPLVMFTIAPLISSAVKFYIHEVSLITSATIVSMVVLLYYFSVLDTNTLIEKAHKREIQMLLEKQESITQMVSQTTLALVEAIDAKDTYTKGHSKRVAEYSKMIAKKCGMTEDEINEIYLIALLHDVGKIGIPDDIINKVGSLTDEEIEIMQKHPVIGREILGKISISPKLSIGASFHHERYDGKGYPFGLKGEEIPEIARIIAVADTYDAMASERSYRDILPQYIVREEIENCIGTQFDPKFANAMLEIIDEDRDYNLRQKD